MVEYLFANMPHNAAEKWKKNGIDVRKISINDETKDAEYPVIQ